MTITSINDYKKSKKNKTIEKDLKVIIYIYNLSINALKHFKHYVSVMEVISVLQSNKTLCELYLSKLEKKNVEKVDETSPPSTPAS